MIISALQYDFYLRLGRQALGVALKTLGRGDLGILLPEFICRDVPETCRRMGFAIRWYRVNARLQAVGLSQMPACRAVLAVHYFGFQQDLRPFQKYCEKTGAVLIEDAAHGYLSTDPGGKQLGTTGDFGIYSFRKILPIPDGAALVTKASWKKKIPALGEKTLSQNPGLARLWTAKIAFAKRFPGLLVVARRVWKPIKSVLVDSRAHHDPQSPHPGLPETLRRLDQKQEIKRRQSAWKKLKRLGVRVGVRPVFSRLPKGVCPYGFAFRGTPRDRSLEHEALRQGFSIIQWPDLPREIRNRKSHKDFRVGLVNFLLPPWK